MRLGRFYLGAMYVVPAKKGAQACILKKRDGLFFLKRLSTLSVLGIDGLQRAEMDTQERRRASIVLVHSHGHRQPAISSRAKKSNARSIQALKARALHT